ncbi:MAG TPA: ATP-binding protein [Myxococcota bacterium]|nr:ATP-binding protein [Myxococcota bacterium]
MSTERKKPLPSESDGGILIVDDEQNVLNALKRTLARHFKPVHTAITGEQGLEVLEREKDVQVVISDFFMPGMDGVAFLKEVRGSWPDIQRVMLTGQASFEAIERAINEAEVYRFLNKPWNDSQLVASVRECVDHVGLIRSNRDFKAELAERNLQLEEVNRDLERQVEQRTRALVQAEKMVALGRMAGGVAHEINNPLGGILAFVQLLLRDGPGLERGQLDESLNTIQGCALRCKEIVDNLLSFSRPPSPGDRSRLGINGVAESAAAIVRLHPKAKRVAIGLDLDPGDPQVLGQAGKLEQIVVNLLQNAFFESEPGQEVLVKTGMEGDKVALWVRDHGQGIPPRVLPRIFEPFFSTKEPGEGSGLGLFISYGIAREHGGELSAENSEGGGATFTLRLPALGRQE